MEEFWIPLLTTLMFLCQTASAGDTIEVIGAVGRSVTLRSLNTTTDADAAFWNFGSIPVVTVPLKDPSQPLFQDKFKTRFTVSERGRALRISQLSMEDAGTYSVTIGEKTSTFILLVYKELAELRVTCEAQNCSDGSCSFSLRCSVPDADFGNVSYIWRKWDQPWDEGSGVLLVVNKSSLDEPEPVTCTAQNAVSSRNVTVTTPGVLCSENFTHPPGLPGALSGKSIGIGVAAAMIGVAVLLLVSLVLWKSRGLRKVRLSKPNPTDTAATAENTTVYTEVGHSQQRIPNGIKAKPTGEESSTTIYSLVKRPEKVGDREEENAYATGLELV